jgi:ABC-2 type transport system permease protein
MIKIWRVAERDFRMFIRYKFLLIMRAIWFLAQIALFGLVTTRMVKVPNYFDFYIGGVIITLLYSTTMFIGYDIFEEAEHGVTEYLLSIPVSRRELVLGRSIGGGLRSFIYVGPLMTFILLITGIDNPLNFLISFASLFLFAFGVSGLSILLAVGIKSHDKYDIFLGVFNALIVRFSTVLYPVGYMPDAYSRIAEINPLTFAADLFRWGTGVESYFATPWTPLIALLLFFCTFTFVSVTFYERRLEGGGWE